RLVVEPPREDSDNRHRHVLDTDRPADSVRRAAEPALPVAVAEERDALAPLVHVVEPDGATDNWLDAVDVEEVLRRLADADPFRPYSIDDEWAEPTDAACACVREYPAGCAPLAEVGDRRRVLAAAGDYHRHLDQLFGVRIRQRAQQRRVDDAEERGR